MSHAVHFGAGNIGRGFLGPLYSESGLETVFVDVAAPLVEALNARGAYPLRIVSDEGNETRQITGVRAVSGRDIEAVARELVGARIVSTAVGVNVLPHIAAALARGVELRFGAGGSGVPLDIIVCENLLNAGPFLRGEMRKHLPEPLHDLLNEKVGCVEASIGRMVPVMTPAQQAEDPLLVCVEPYCELPVDAWGFKGPIPEIKHLKAIPNFGAYVERKLFIHNMSHAACAYLGHLRGHEFIAYAIRDPWVRERVEAAMNEAIEGLARRHGLDRDALRAHRDDLIHRYHNRALGDQIGRVGRDPMRKLGPDDRLIGAARLCLENEVAPKAIALAAAAAILYHNDDDPAAVSLEKLRAAAGLSGVLERVCGVAAGSALAMHIAEEVGVLEAEMPPLGPVAEQGGLSPDLM